MRLYLRCMVRESRGARGRLVFFISCLAVGVAAVVAVASLSEGLDHGLRAEARPLLAADLVVEGRRPMPAELDRWLAARPGLEAARIKEMATVVAVPAARGQPGRSQLVELKAVEGGYPFYGDLRLDPPGPLPGRLGPNDVLVAPGLLERLELAPGQPLLIGGEPFVIVGTVLSEPDRVGDAFSLGPRVFVSHAGLSRTPLERFGSRVLYRLLLRLPPDSGAGDVRKVAATIRKALADGAAYRVETYLEAQPTLREGLARVERFLGLVALLSLLVGGVGVAQTVRAWLAGRYGAIAILRCLGLRPREIVLLYLGQTLLLGLVGSLAGTLAGLVVAWSLPRLIGDILPAALPVLWQPLAAARGLGLGLGIAVLFSLSPLIAARRVPPSRVLRRDAEPLPHSRWALALSALALVAGVWGTASLQAASLRLGTLFTAGVVVAAAILATAALGIVRGAGLLPRSRTRIWLRYGLAALARPGAATAGAIVALGLGVLVVLGMSLVQTGLSQELNRSLPRASPTAFLIDIQPDQWSGVRRLLAANGASGVDSVPVVTARLSSIDGRPVRDLATARSERSDRRWALTREQRLTYLADLPPDNSLVAGELWSDPNSLELSVEEGFAQDLGIGLGARLVFDIQGLPVELLVTSLRRVDWRTFGINFFLVAEPAALEEAPQFRLAAARLPAGREQEVQDLLAVTYPNITLLHIREILEKIGGLLQRLGWGVRFLGGFTVLAGIVILGGAISAGSVRRAREVALLKTLGLTRWGVAAIFATEYSLVGLVAGLIGAGGGSLLSWAVLTRGMELAWRLRPGHLAAAVGATVLLTVASGIAASWEALSRRPVQVLRDRQ